MTRQWTTDIDVYHVMFMENKLHQFLLTIPKEKLQKNVEKITNELDALKSEMDKSMNSLTKETDDSAGEKK